MKNVAQWMFFFLAVVVVVVVLVRSLSGAVITQQLVKGVSSCCDHSDPEVICCSRPDSSCQLVMETSFTLSNTRSITPTRPMRWHNANKQ